MSIVRRGSGFVPICDMCGDALATEYDFYDAVDAKKAAGWRSVKDDYGDWQDVCPDCARDMRYGPATAAEDFSEIGGAK